MLANLVRILAQELKMSSTGKIAVKFVSRTMSLAAALLVPTLLFAQNCALCYTQAAGAGHRIVQALRGGILMLIVPPMFICIALGIMAYRKRNHFHTGR
jgi:hypothetical protein